MAGVVGSGLCLMAHDACQGRQPIAMAAVEANAELGEALLVGRSAVARRRRRGGLVSRSWSLGALIIRGRWLVGWIVASGDVRYARLFAASGDW